MHQISLGKVTVATAGTTVKLATVAAALKLPDNILNNGKMVFKIEVFPILSNTGTVFVGLTTTSRQAPAFLASTGVGVIKEIQKPATSGPIDVVTIQASEEQNAVNISDYLLDVSVNGEGAYVVLTVA